MKIIVNTLIVCSLLLGACSKEMVEADSMTISALRQSELLGQWKFKSYADGKTPAYDITLEIKDEDGKYAFNGRSSVNFYFASPQIDENKKTISIEGVGSTKIAGSLEANQFEAAYYENLRNIERYELKDKSTLIFHISKPTKEAMYFERK
ncbi:META domain-containing protein [Emticicia sp. W12TSBA100-4]|uniref:META domain-containing protein n=1 Tax=Emticicia sp. W12TSBA100-4 TaxID=3160965 RepID=UPI0033059503